MYVPLDSPQRFFCFRYYAAPACMLHPSLHFVCSIFLSSLFLIQEKIENGSTNGGFLIYALVQGLRVDIRTENRMGLLSNVTRVFRENGLSISRVEIGTEGEKAVGSFFVTDSSGQEVNPNIAELVRQECGGTVVTDHKSPYRVPQSSSSSVMNETKSNMVARPIFSLGSMLWSQIERLSGNFGPIRS